MSDCACLYGGFDDYDSAGFQCSEARRARKPHVCRECKGTIQPGDTYEHFSSKQDGDIFTVKTCATCAEIRRSLYCEGFYFGSLWDDIQAQLFPRFTVNCVAKLQTVAAKTELQQRYMAYVDAL